MVRRFIVLCALFVMFFYVNLFAENYCCLVSHASEETVFTTDESLSIPSKTSQQVKVKLKNGTTITGTLKSFDPVTSITLIVGGQETTISMKSVESVDMVENSPSLEVVPKLEGQKLIVTETQDYPSEIVAQIGNEVVRMLLVKGGRMNMGYDGDHSWKMESEPVHEVEVTSFYISERPLPKSLVSKYCRAESDENGAALVSKFKDVQVAIDKIRTSTGKSFRLPTEAEWEYAASCEQQGVIFADVTHKKKIAYDWCSDFYDEYKEGGIIVDPTGPSKGIDRVVRAFNNKYGKYNRRNELSVGRYTLGCIRLVIKAKDI